MRRRQYESRRTVTRALWPGDGRRAPASFGTAHSVPLCPTLPLHLWRARGRLRRPARAEPAGGQRAVRAHAICAADRLASQRSRCVRAGRQPLMDAFSARSIAARTASSSPARRSRRRPHLVQHARRVAVIPFGIRLDRFRQLDDRAACACRVDSRAVTRDRGCSSSAGSCTTRASTCWSTPWPGSPARCCWRVKGRSKRRFARARRSAGVIDRVQFVGRVTDADLPAYYHAADVVRAAVGRSNRNVRRRPGRGDGRRPCRWSARTCRRACRGSIRMGSAGSSCLRGNVPALAAALARLGADEALQAAPGRRRAQSRWYDASRSNEWSVRSGTWSMTCRGSRPASGRPASSRRGRDEREAAARRVAVRRRVDRVVAALGDRRRGHQARVVRPGVLHAGARRRRRPSFRRHQVPIDGRRTPKRDSGRCRPPRTIRV